MANAQVMTALSPPRERVVGFGGNTRLSGILTIPEELNPKGPTVVLLNSGLIHRVGACRVSVNLARKLASCGNPVLRFDFSGIGDSGPRPSGVSMEEARIREIREALDFLSSESMGSRFVLYGLCSGARDAFHSALEDVRVCGLVQIDGFAYRTWLHHLLHYGRRIVEPGAWARYVRRKILEFRAKDRPPSNHHDPGENMILEVWPDYPPRRVVAEGYRTLVRRGVRFHVIFTGSWEDEYNYPRQFFHMYPEVDFGESVTLRYMPHAVHILPQPHVQREVMEGVVGWVKSENWEEAEANHE